MGIRKNAPRLNRLTCLPKNPRFERFEAGAIGIAVLSTGVVLGFFFLFRADWNSTVLATSSTMLLANAVTAIQAVISMNRDYAEKSRERKSFQSTKPKSV